MSDAIQVDIVTPEKKIFSENNILSVTVPGIEGDMGILNNHIPIITFLRPGTIQIQAQNKDSSFFISDGVLEFSNNVLTILASEIYDLATIDPNTIDISIVLGSIVAKS
jgi:F-type H+-transporting ATPase subunit epsilon